MRHLISNLGLAAITASGVTFHGHEGDAQARDRIPGDVAQSGWSAALALVHSGQTSEVLTLGHSLLILLPVQH